MRILRAIVLPLALHTSFTPADEPQWIKVSGFGTLGVAHSNNKEADFRQNLEQSVGTGRTHKIDSALDSAFGVQADAMLNDRLQATAQVISRRQTDNSTRPYIEWANLRWQIASNLDAHGGRIVAPMFMVSDARMVGHAQLTVRPPGEVYLINPITYINGADVNYRIDSGRVLYRMGASGGKVNQALTSSTGTTAYHYDVRVLHAGLEFADSTLRTAYTRAYLDSNSDTLSLFNTAINQLIAQGVGNASQLKDLLAYRNVPIDFYSLGYAYDGYPWQIQVEWARRQFTRSSLGTDLDGGYALAGYHIGRFTPFLMYAHLSHKSRTEIAPVETGSLPTGGQKVIQGMISNAQGRHARNSLTLGGRWDMAENLALKLQVDHIRKPGGNNSGYFAPPIPADFAAQHRDIMIYSANLDFVF